MRKKLLVLFFPSLLSCASSQSSNQPTAAADNNASNVSRDGLSVSRPSSWQFVTPDKSVAPDTVVILQGPIGDKQVLAPAVEISKRALDAAQRRRKASHVLTQMVTEVVQLFDGFEMVGSPEDMQLAGKDAARVQLKYSESLPDGGSTERAAQFYGIVDNDKIWVIRCVGPMDGSANADFDAILKSIELS